VEGFVKQGITSLCYYIGAFTTGGLTDIGLMKKH
jgi:hypothetical protein